jgi:hypothetical protein
MPRVLFIATLLAVVTSISLPAAPAPSTTFLPGGSFDRAADVVVDAGGRVFLAINTQSRDYGQPQRLSPLEAWLPVTNAFVTRIDPNGALTHWPVAEASLQAITIDPAGNIYVVGSRRGEAFFARLRPSGSVEYSITFGGAADDVARDIAVDPLGNIFIAGVTSSADFRSTIPEQACNAGQTFSDAFLVRIDPHGTIAESTCLGGSSTDYAYAVGLNAKGEAVVAGATRSADFPATPGAFQERFADRPCVPRIGCGDVFVATLSAGDLRVLWASYLGGSGGENPEGFTLDAAGDIYITGWTMSRDLPLHDPVQTECHTAYAGTDCGDAFVAKLAGSGSSLLFGSFIGGSRWETATDVATSSTGLLYVSGTTSSADLLTRQFETPRPGDTDGFVLILDRANDVLDVRVVDRGRNERMEGVATGTHGLLHLIGAVDVAVPPGTPCCYSDRDAYVITTR